MTRLLLVGAGHAHLHLIRHAARLRAAGYELALIAPRWFHYSGTASAIACGDLPPAAGTIDVADLTYRHGVRHHVGLLEDLDLAVGRACTDTRVEVGWDVVSFNVGSVLDPGPIAVGPGALTVKPLDSLATLAARLCLPGTASVRVSVVGGGNSGVEIAAHAAARLRQTRTPGHVVLLHAGETLAPDLPGGARRRLAQIVGNAGVQVRTGVAVREVHHDHALLADGTRLDHDLAVLATGLRAPALVSRLGLGDERGIPVRDTLIHPDHPGVYAVGDCAHFLPQPLPRIGVHGVRQAPVLLASLLARAAGDPLPRYVPQRRWLAVLDLGGGRALAVRGRWWWSGRSARLLKRAIDRRWLRRYRAPRTQVPV
ncbi:MAG: NAD(P)/FAD-dependent oxidoreductase [Sporichthyaceae bacterium]